MAAPAAAAALLGGATVLGRDVHTDIELAAEIAQGLPSGSLTHLVEELHPALSPQLIYALVGSDRALDLKQRNRERLSPSESDRLARLARIAVRAEEALGDRDTAYRWLGTHNRALEGRQPLELLGTDAGATEMQEVLVRIEHGVYG